MGTIHVRISRKGRAVPCWVRIVDSEGRPKVPFGRNLSAPSEPLQDVGGHWITNGQFFSAESGSFEIELDSGPHRIEVLKSPVWAGPLVRVVSVLTRQLSVRLALDDGLTNPTGWVAGDLRVHGISANIARFEAEASGMGVVQVQAGYRWPQMASPPSFHELLEFSGSKTAAVGDSAVVAVNTLNRHPHLGSASLLHAHRPIFPWGWGWNASEGSGEKPWAVADWLAQCHRIAGVTVWPELAAELPEFEMIAGLILGDVDVVELSASLELPVSDSKSRLPLLYDLFNHGVFPAVAGASGKDSNQTRTGEKFTWVHCDSDSAPYGNEPSEASSTPWTPDQAGLDRFMAGLRRNDAVASVGPWFAFEHASDSLAFVRSRSCEVVYLGMVAGARLQIVSAQGVLWEKTVEHSMELQRFAIQLAEDPLVWFLLRLVDVDDRLLAHGSPHPALISGDGHLLYMGRSLVQRRLLQGLEWVQPGGVGYFTPQIVAYLEKALSKLSG